MTLKLAAALAFAAAGCDLRSPDEQLLDRFFEASRLYDTTVAGRFADVTFHPRTDGIVDDFTIVASEHAGDEKRLTVRAAIRQIDGRTSEQRLLLLLARRERHWVITRITRLPASRTSRGASSVRPRRSGRPA